MAIAFTFDTHAQDNVSANNIVLTTTIAYPAGSQIIVGTYAAGFGGSVSSVADSKGNTYTVDVSGSTSGKIAIVSAPAGTALAIGDTITVTFSGTITGHGVWAGYISGQAASPKDKTQNGSGVSSPASSGNTATTTQADEIDIGHAMVTGVAVTQDGAFTNIDNFTAAGGAVTIIAGYKIVSATGAQAYAPTFSGSHSWVSMIATYKQLVASPPGPYYYQFLAGTVQ